MGRHDDVFKSFINFSSTNQTLVICKLLVLWFLECRECRQPGTSAHSSFCPCKPSSESPSEFHSLSTCLFHHCKINKTLFYCYCLSFIIFRQICDMEKNLAVNMSDFFNVYLPLAWKSIIAHFRTPNFSPTQSRNFNGEWDWSSNISQIRRKVFFEIFFKNSIVQKFGKYVKLL